ncbi:hypothetical protein EJ04DRAFT_454880 [Polyplosphaeria fusca]|uniref:Nuclear envelope protein n=1 Tax=Polyplosphaeria fusca TaxID=682080 RepID=A0A9P4R7V3_9PLEO|nr:hypothetical protein EJ04DRAFT_454880 [Polyplosphaeria fusca]
MAPVKPRPYSDFLTPSLHRRFTRVLGHALLVSYLLSIWMGQWYSWIWSWFPIGVVGVRALGLLLPILTLLIPRVAQFHVGKRNTTSPFETWLKYALTKTSFVTFAAHVLSAWVFGEIYIASRPTSTRLGATDPGKLHERIRLNERPLYLRFLFVTLGVIEACIYLWKDYDRIDLKAVKPKQDRKTAEAAAAGEDDRVKDTATLLSYQTLVKLAWHAGISASVAFGVGTFVYFAILRTVLWEWNAWFWRMMLFSFGKSTRPTGLPPFGELVLMFAAEGTLLGLLWGFVNESFDLYMAQDPLKAGQPITNDSKDPNGSLLSGLKSKKEQTKNVAFLELALITERFPERRKAIYDDAERPKGEMYKQVSDICIAEVKEIARRINVVNSDLKPESNDGNAKPPAPVELVPRISVPLSDGAKMAAAVPAPTTTREMFERSATQFAHLHSSPENVEKNVARGLLKAGQGKAIESAQKAMTTWESYKHHLASSPIGYPFRRSLSRTANTVILGAPYSRQSLIINAITVLANLTVFSLEEDVLGQFNQKVPEIVRALTLAIKSIEAYMAGLPVHWSDVDTLALPESQRKKVPEVEDLLNTLKVALRKVLGSFNEYLTGMGLSRVEIREAKEVVSEGQPMMMARG